MADLPTSGHSAISKGLLAVAVAPPVVTSIKPVAVPSPTRTVKVSGEAFTTRARTPPITTTLSSSS
ncbi:MAG: hypothetical protein M3488_00795, partial [Actinomycetota bacterium]|nr:hypothetical protein [Actinomycetota bacterium]